MRIILFLLLLQLCCAVPFAPVFRGGDTGFPCFRVPSLISTPAGSVLAFSEGRKSHNCDGIGQIRIVMSRSTDNGTTWSPARMVNTNLNHHAIKDPCPVIGPNNSIYLFFTADSQRIYVISSTDDGQTWQSEQDITYQVADPRWSWVGLGAGGIVMQSIAGRIVIPAYYFHQQTPGSYVFYSDDARTWHRGQPTELGGADCQAVELPNGNVLLNSAGPDHSRIMSISQDGGKSWIQNITSNLPQCSKCQGSTIDANGIYYFSAPTGEDPMGKSNNMCLYYSTNPSQNWQLIGSLWKGPAGFSSLAVLPSGNVGLLFERGDIQGIVFGVVS